MLRLSLRIAFVSLLVLASSATAAPIEAENPVTMRASIAAVWQKIAALFAFERLSSPLPDSQAKDGTTVMEADDQGDGPLEVAAARLSVLPNG